MIDDGCWMVIQSPRTALARLAATRQIVEKNFISRVDLQDAAGLGSFSGKLCNDGSINNQAAASCPLYTSAAIDLTDF
jgi:hypothetical protein